MADESEFKSQFAARLGVSKARISQLTKQGLPVRDGKVPVQQAIRWLRDNGKLAASLGGHISSADAGRRSSAADPPIGSDPALDELAERLARGDLLSKVEAERVKENYLARLRQLEYEQKAGELVPIDDVEREHASRCQRIRSRLLALPDETASAIAQQIGGNAGDVREIVQESVNYALEELAHGHGGSS